jgi:hypothetical protein
MRHLVESVSADGICCHFIAANMARGSKKPSTINKANNGAAAPLLRYVNATSRI